MGGGDHGREGIRVYLLCQPRGRRRNVPAGGQEHGRDGRIRDRPSLLRGYGGESGMSRVGNGFICSGIGALASVDLISTEPGLCIWILLALIAFCIGYKNPLL